MRAVIQLQIEDDSGSFLVATTCTFCDPKPIRDLNVVVGATDKINSAQKYRSRLEIHAKS